MINVKITGITALFNISGRLDVDLSPQLLEELENLNVDVKEIVFDFAELEYMSSMGLRAILTAYKMMKEPNRNGRFLVRNVPSNIQKVFKLSGFLQTFERDEKLVILEKSLSAGEADYSLLGELNDSTAPLIQGVISALKVKDIKKVSLDCERLKSISPAGCFAIKKARQALGGIIYMQNTSEKLKVDIERGGLLSGGILILNNGTPELKKIKPHSNMPSKTSRVENVQIIDNVARYTCHTEKDFSLIPFTRNEWYGSHAFVKKIIIDASAFPELSLVGKSCLNASRDIARQNGVEVELKT
ncbi:MAG: hypothetical protein Ta2B_07810 [Termitinemataceae bacterium]|nr:MAG: hypothetical protein Ta2B_07810 [Termitinemataceae bacterium]